MPVAQLSPQHRPNPWRRPKAVHPTARRDWLDLQQRQDGAFSRAQALSFGITDSMMVAQLKARRWQRLYPSTFVAHNGQVGFRTRAWAAVLACGDSAVASHRTAAYLAGLVDQAPAAVEVSVPASRRPRGAAGIVVRRRRIALQGIGSPPRTTVEATVLDLADATARADEVVAVLTAACQRRLSTAGRLAAAAAERSQLRWRELIDEVLEDGDGVHSALEWRYRRDVERAHGLPRADRQAPARTVRSSRWRDARYSRYGLVVELDGAAAHPEERRHRDRARDNGIVVAGDAPLSYGWYEIAGFPCETAAQVAAVLKARGWKRDARPCGPACALRGASWSPQS